MDKSDIKLDKTVQTQELNPFYVKRSIKDYFDRETYLKTFKQGKLENIILLLIGNKGIRLKNGTYQNLIFSFNSFSEKRFKLIENKLQFNFPLFSREISFVHDNINIYLSLKNSIEYILANQNK